MVYGHSAEADMAIIRFTILRFPVSFRVQDVESLVPGFRLFQTLRLTVTPGSPRESVLMQAATNRICSKRESRYP